MLTPDVLARLCRAREMLSDTSDASPSVRRVARAVGISPFHFIRTFRAIFGETPHQFRTRARLDAAKRLLASSDRSVTDVCMDVGFSSVGSFSDLFARRVGASPTGYRRRLQSAVQGSDPADHLSPGCLTLMRAAFAISEKRSGES
jgi:AraC-like DNA-binding protein